ncbi:TPA: glycosyltransferase family 4 protein, partial [Klebsiella pneumoniae]|nr:glycosyltransferase family 4 protein [Klebsiella pneumoniae]
FIFTVSEFSKSRIVQWSGQDPSKIINVGNGVAECFTPEGDKKNFGFKYLLCVSNRKTHKNEYNTILAFKKSGLYNEYKLVFTGSPNETISDFIEHHGLTESVHFTGYLKDDELPLLYRGAAALVFVSFYEGFGLPVIEAMASGIPVVTSRTTSLGEVAGDAALLVDPENINEIADAINQIILDNNCRQQLINKGLMQARKFTWEEVARKVDNHLR